MDWVTAIVMLVASFVIQAAMAPKQQVQPPAAFDDFNFPQAEEGTPQAVYFGEVWSTSWMVLAVGNYRTTAIRTSGGKK